jgi:hypothetical protein
MVGKSANSYPLNTENLIIILIGSIHAKTITQFNDQLFHIPNWGRDYCVLGLKILSFVKKDQSLLVIKQ